MTLFSTETIFIFCCFLSCFIQIIARPQDSSASEDIDNKPRCGKHNPCGTINPSQNCSVSSDPFETKFGEWPHMCAILKSRTVVSNSGEQDKEVQEFFAGASLIAPGVLLTAAHWVK